MKLGNISIFLTYVPCNSSRIISVMLSFLYFQIPADILFYIFRCIQIFFSWYKKGAYRIFLKCTSLYRCL